MNTKIVSALLIIILFLCACSPEVSPQILNGQVIGLYPGTALKIVRDAASGCTGCFMWAKTLSDGTIAYVFAKPFRDMWGFVLMAGDNSAWDIFLKTGGAGGNAVSIPTFSEFVSCIESNGWKTIKPSDLPGWMRLATFVSVAYHNAVNYSQRIAASVAAKIPQSTFFISVPLSSFDTMPQPNYTIDN